MARNFIGPIILCLTFSLLLSHAQGIDNNAKTAIVKGILKKVLNLTLASFTNITNQERKKMMINVEEKLRKSSQFLGPYKSEKYVKLIIDGVRSLTKNTNTKDFDGVWDDSSNEGREGIVDTDLRNSNVNAEKKEKLIKKTAKKIQAIAEASIRDAKTPEQREEVVSDIQKQVIDAAIKKHVSMNQQDAQQLNTNLVAKTIIKMMAEEAAMKKNVLKKPEARRMEFEFTDNIDVNKNLEPENYLGSISKKNSVDNEIELNIKNVTLKLPCANRNAIICDKIKALRVIKCGKKDLSVEKLCDGFNDCSDYTDERNCATHGVEKVKSASQIMSDINRSLSDDCNTTEINDKIVTKQNEILSHVLKSQLKFIHKHVTERVINSNQSTLRKTYSESETVKKTMHEVAVVITTLSFALENTFCSSKSVEETRKFNALDDILQKDFDNEAAKTSTWSPNSCKCIEEYCEGTCNKDCGTLCLQRYQIDRWQCKAVNNKKSIPLDLICDGKLDCFDESDENGCSAATGFEKFEAINMYNFVIEMISTKTTLAKFVSIRGKLIKLQGLIKELQKLTSRQRVDVMAVKSLRNECFSMMTSIYDLTKYYAVNMDSMHDIHRFLMSATDKLVIAMKRSHTGNEKIIASEGCLCSENKCLHQRCSKTCLRACPAVSKLTRYYCGGLMMMNQSIPVEALCNGKVDCPGKDDEEDCSLDICRKHHLVVLRHNLREVTTEQGSTSITGALISWKTKESAMLRILETNERPTPMVLRDTVRDMLHDLVMAYASSSIPKRRSNDDVIQQFYRVALVVMNTLKSCSK